MAIQLPQPTCGSGWFSSPYFDRAACVHERDETVIAGKVVERNGKAALAVSGSDLVYLLGEGPDAKGKVADLRKQSGKDVTVKGHLPESAGKATEPSTLEVRDFTVG